MLNIKAERAPTMIRLQSSESMRYRIHAFASNFSAEPAMAPARADNTTDQSRQ